VEEMRDEIEGLKESECVNEALANSITKAFEECDNRYKAAFPG